ncbi:MAG TPA: glycosyltransferase [Vicinamibacterales bacterium]|nr:glycosyltransferase [Vicinamibacterales bacterium]
MIPVVHLLSGERPGAGGVGDYTGLLQSALERRGARVSLWDVRQPGFRATFERTLRADPGVVLLQYVPNALGWRGLNVPFCAWVSALRRRGHDVRVMFHEPYFYFGWRRPWLNAVALAQRLMAAMLLRRAGTTYVSTATWVRYLQPFAPASTRFVTTPIPSTLPPPAPALETEWHRRLSTAPPSRLVCHFGTYGRHVADALTPVVRSLLSRRGDVRLVCVGRGSDRFVDALKAVCPQLADRLLATGALDGAAAAAALRACEVAVQPYPDGVTTRRTSIMAPLSLGVPTVTSLGFLTEPVWGAVRAVALAPAGDADAHARLIEALLDDETARAATGATGAAAYEAHFSVDRTVDAILAPPASVA